MATQDRPKTLTGLSERFAPMMAARGIDRKSVELLACVFENWLLGEQGESSSHLRSTHFKERDRLEPLTHRLVRETNRRFEPSFEAFAILLVHRKQCATRLRPSMDWAFKEAGRRLKADADQTLAPFDDFLKGAPTSVKTADFAHSIKLLSSGGLGIHEGLNGMGEPVVTYSLEVRRYPDTLAAVNHYLTLTDRGPMQRPSLEATTFSLETLSLAPEAYSNATKALERAGSDPSGAITSARTTLEATLKWIAHECGVELGKNPSVQELLAACKAPLALDSDITLDLMRAVETLGRRLIEIRNTFGDAHGSSPSAAKASRSEARYVTSTSLVLSAYLLERYEAKNMP